MRNDLILPCFGTVPQEWCWADTKTLDLSPMVYYTYIRPHFSVENTKFSGKSTDWDQNPSALTHSLQITLISRKTDLFALLVWYQKFLGNLLHFPIYYFLALPIVSSVLNHELVCQLSILKNERRFYIDWFFSSGRGVLTRILLTLTSLTSERACQVWGGAPGAPPCYLASGANFCSKIMFP